MSPETRGKLQAEADLIGRFAETYRRKFSTLIERMNHRSDPHVDVASLKLCVEAVDMMLATQTQIANALCEISNAKIAA